MIVILHGLDGEEETVANVDHVHVGSTIIRYYFENDDTTLFLRDNLWRNLDTNQAWKDVSVCPR